MLLSASFTPTKRVRTLGESPTNRNVLPEKAAEATSESENLRGFRGWGNLAFILSSRKLGPTSLLQTEKFKGLP